MKYSKLEDLSKIQQNMEKHGGGFVKALSWAMVKADYMNLRKIQKTWPDLFDEYYNM